MNIFIKFLFALSLLLTNASFAGEIVVLDVRTPAEYKISHIQGSLNIDFLDHQFSERIQTLDRNLDYKIYCRSGNRAGKAIAMMNEYGFKKLENLGSLQEATKKLVLPCEGEQDAC